MTPPPHPPKKMSAKGKFVYPNLRQLLKNKESIKKKYFTINFIHKEHVRSHLSLPINVTVSIFTVSAFIFPTLIPNMLILLTAIPQHFIMGTIQSTGHTALLKTLYSYFW
jgi:hypothetical protein